MLGKVALRSGSSHPDSHSEVCQFQSSVTAKYFPWTTADPIAHLHVLIVHFLCNAQLPAARGFEHHLTWYRVKDNKGKASTADRERLVGRRKRLSRRCIYFGAAI